MSLNTSARQQLIIAAIVDGYMYRYDDHISVSIVTCQNLYKST